MSPDLLTAIPPHLRQETIKALKGHVAIKFPVGYSLKHAKGMTTLSLPDAEGNVVKTHSSRMVLQDFIKRLEEKQASYEIINL